MMNIVICEDDDSYSSLIVNYTKAILADNDLDGRIVYRCRNSADLQKYCEENEANVFLLDIELANMQNGYDLAIFLRRKFPKCYIVFISEHLEYVFKAFKVNAFDFLPKPVTKNILSKCLLAIHRDLAEMNFEIEHKDMLSIRTGNKIYSVLPSDILIIEKFGNKAVIHLKDKSIVCYETLESLASKLKSKSIIRCHKSFLVNKQYIREIDLATKEVHLITGQKCYFGLKYKGELVNDW